MCRTRPLQLYKGHGDLFETMCILLHRVAESVVDNPYIMYSVSVCVLLDVLARCFILGVYDVWTDAAAFYTSIVLATCAWGVSLYRPGRISLYGFVGGFVIVSILLIVPLVPLHLLLSHMTSTAPPQGVL